MNSYLDTHKMIKLLNEKREQFAQGLASGLTQDQAYIAAGFSPNNAKSAASNLLRKDKNIKKRVKEIHTERENMFVRAGTIPVIRAFRKLGIDKETICEQLWDNAMQSKAAIPVLDKQGNPTGVYNANWNASNKALELLGKELGMFGDKEDVPVNEYANLTTKEILKAIVEKCDKMGIQIKLPVIEGESIRLE